ncbi:MAG: serine/threonine-protein phosphatase [Myxococcales bacterium]|nr:serine/threonine-protein phosphatase [Myxococcales bacterium]
MRIDCFAQTDVGPVRTYNEDGYAFDARTGLYAVFDGMGGQSSGVVAVEIATRELRAFADELPGIAATHHELEERARTLLQRINRGIQEDQTKYRTAYGTTAVLLAIGTNEALVAHVGDSRAYRWREGSFEQMTDDHSLVAEVRRSGEVPPGYSLEQIAEQFANVITRCVGYGSELLVDTRIEELHPRDAWLLCSDGLWRALANDAIAEELDDESDPSSVCRALVERALARGAEDNVTAMVVTARR